MNEKTRALLSGKPVRFQRLKHAAGACRRYREARLLFKGKAPSIMATVRVARRHALKRLFRIYPIQFFLENLIGPQVIYGEADYSGSSYSEYWLLGPWAIRLGFGFNVSGLIRSLEGGESSHTESIKIGWNPSLKWSRI